MATRDAIKTSERINESTEVLREANTGRRVILPFLLYPFALIWVLNHPSPSTAAPFFRSTAWIVSILGFFGFLAACCVAYTMVRDAIAEFRTRQEAEEDIEATDATITEPVQTRPVLEDRPVARNEILEQLLAATPAASDTEVDVSRTSSTDQEPNFNADQTAHDDGERFTMAPAAAASTSETYIKATDPSLPWPMLWSDEILEATRKQYGIGRAIPALIGVTRWDGEGQDIQRGKLAPLVHLLAPGSSLSFLGVGGSGTGKSDLAQTMLLSAAWMADPDHFQFQVIELDANGANFSTVTKLPHCIGAAYSKKQAAALYHDIEQEHGRRTRLFRNASRDADRQIDDIDSYNKWASEEGQLLLPIRIVVIDEIRSFIRAMDSLDDKELDGNTLIEHIAYAMRKTGIGPFLFTQYPVADVLPRIAKTQITTIFSGKLEDEIQRRVVFGAGKTRYDPVDLPGIDPLKKTYAGRRVLRIRGREATYITQAVYCPSPLKEQVVEEIRARHFQQVPESKVLTELFDH